LLYKHSVESRSIEGFFMDQRALSLSLNASRPYLPVVTQFVESAATVFGLQKEAYLRLGLATEEIFLYLSDVLCPDKPLEVECLNGFYYVRVYFRFSAVELTLSSLNVASTIASRREDDLNEMGLMIASRSIDHLHLVVEKNHRVCLSITKDKTYPRYEGKLPLPQPAQRIVTEAPDAEGLKDFAVLTAQQEALPSRPAFFDSPGKLVDMVHEGQYSVLAAKNQKNEVIGGMVLHRRTEQIVQCFGPYSFRRDQEREIGEALLNACLAGIARTKALGLLSLSGLPEFLRNHFDALGALRYRGEGGTPVEEVAYYRLLHEDPGFEVWSSASLTDYLRREYKRLALAREIRPIRDMGEATGESSLFSAELHRDRFSVTLRPLLPGKDLAANLARHLRFLREDRFLNIYFELDLGMPWHAGLMDALLEARFKPGIIIPFAGKSDLLIMQHDDETES
jgi:hypothetical protein